MVNEFIGLTLVGGTQYNDPKYAVEAYDIITENGKIEGRPGRVELSEAQNTILALLGGQVFFPVSGTRKMVLVRTDGIFVRSE